MPVPRPPQWTPENAARFRDRTVVAAYHLRLPYPPAIFDVLLNLLPDRNLPVLDLGTGTGEIARELAPWVKRVDAVDASPAMIARLRETPGGNHPSLNAFVGRAEDIASNEPYGLITAGDSLHWMDWDLLLPRLAHLLVPEGCLAIVHRNDVTPPWQPGLLALIAEYSTSKDYETFDLIAELERRGLFEVSGRTSVTPQASTQPVADYIESFHSRSSFSREHMPPGTADRFDQHVRDLVTPWANKGALHLQTVGEVVWGHPLPVGPTLAST